MLERILKISRIKKQPIIAIPIFAWFGFYHSIIRFLGLQALWAVVKAVSLYAIIWAVSLYAIIWAVIGLMSAVDNIPRSVVHIKFLSIIKRSY